MRTRARSSKFAGDYQLCLASRRAVGLGRGSTVEQINTLVVQETRIRAYAAQEKFELVDYLTDSGTSAEKIKFFDRPKAQEAIALMQMRNCFHLFVTKTDRAFRNHEDCIVTCRILWDDFGISVHFIDEGLVSSREQDRLVLQIRASVAEEENRKRRERQMSTLAVMRADRQRCGRYEPFGWRLDPTRERTTRRGTQSDYLIPDPIEQEHLARLFALMDTLKSTSKVARILNAEGIPPKGKPCYKKKPREDASDSSFVIRHSSFTLPSRGVWYPSTVQSVLEHSSLADGTHCLITNRGPRLNFEFVSGKDDARRAGVAA